MPKPGNPQSWNRFAYVNNNPINYTDPSGHCSLNAKYNPFIGVFNIVKSIKACKESITKAIDSYKYGERRPMVLLAHASGFTDWARDKGDKIYQLNNNVSTVFSNAPWRKRLPAAIDVGWTSVSTAGNLVAAGQAARGISAFTRSGSGGGKLCC